MPGQFSVNSEYKNWKKDEDMKNHKNNIKHKHKTLPHLKCSEITLKSVKMCSSKNNRDKWYSNNAKLFQLCPVLCDPIDYIAHQASLSMRFSRQEYWSGLPFPSPTVTIS